MIWIFQIIVLVYDDVNISITISFKNYEKDICKQAKKRKYYLFPICPQCNFIFTMLLSIFLSKLSEKLSKHIKNREK